MLDRNSRQCLLGELEMAGARVKREGKEIGCPFHEDRHASGGVYQAEDGAWKYKCHAASCGFCGDVFDVVARVKNCPVADVLKTEGPQQSQSKPVEKPKTLKVFATVEAIEGVIPGELQARYTYTNPQTRKPDLIVLRFMENGKKQFWQVSPVVGGWALQRPSGLLPLYNRIATAKAEVVIVVEGEKCVHIMRSANHVATTSPMGAGKAQYADWSPLAGKTIYLWPDNDESGIKHMREVAAILDKMEPACRLFWIEPTTLNLKAKGDVVDLLATVDASLAHSAVLSVMENAEPIGAAKELRDLLEATISGKRSTIPLPWETVSLLSMALLPGTVTLLCGDPGASKSFMLLQAARHWLSLGVRFALFELEEDRAYHLNRLLAQEAAMPDLLDTAWVHSHAEEVRAAYTTHAATIDNFGRRLYAAPDQQVEYRILTQWVEARAADQCRVIAIDPVTAVSPERDVYIADSTFLFTIKTIARESQSSIVLVTHPRKGRQGAIGMDQLAGGAAFQRFSQTILWLEALKKSKQITAYGPVGRFKTQVNRFIHLCKCRNGRGTGTVVGAIWDSQTLTIAEQGAVLTIHKEDDSPASREPGMEG